jgi:DNA ligase-1
MTTLFQKDSKDNMKIWNIFVENRGTHSAIIVSSGRLGGSLVFNESIVREGKNTGRSNATTHYEQALAEMQSTIELKLKKGYVENIEDAKNSAVLGSGIPAPMLAQKYCRDGSQSGSKTLSQLKLTGKTIAVQPKLDGNRCLIKIEDGVAQMYTRSGDLMPVQLDHILNEVYRKFDCILDGELFSDEISFNTLNGLIKRVSVTPHEREKRKLIKYHLYDVMLDEGYRERNNRLGLYASSNIILVPTTFIVASDDEIQKHLELFLAAEYEGLMIRQLGVGYENKRTWQLCKVKNFQDDEFQLLGFDEDVRGGFVGAFVMSNGNGELFRAGASGQSVEERKEMWENPNEYIGRMATVCYFGLSEYGIPRFPKFKCIR